ncbi:MAG: ribonuclease E inhibitor RraB [Pseudooceanicola sp.]
MSHDFASQKQETFASFAELAKDNDLPEEADIDFFFVPGDGADWQPVAEALGDEGFVTEWVEEDEDGGGYLVATLPDQPLSATAIWMAEEHATRIALDRGFAPDGWGFEG